MKKFFLIVLCLFSLKTQAFDQVPLNNMVPDDDHEEVEPFPHDDETMEAIITQTQRPEPRNIQKLTKLQFEMEAWDGHGLFNLETLNDLFMKDQDDILIIYHLLDSAQTALRRQIYTAIYVSEGDESVYKISFSLIPQKNLKAYNPTASLEDYHIDSLNERTRDAICALYNEINGWDLQTTCFYDLSWTTFLICEDEDCEKLNKAIDWAHKKATDQGKNLYVRVTCDDEDPDIIQTLNFSCTPTENYMTPYKATAPLTHYTPKRGVKRKITSDHNAKKHRT